LRQSPNCATFAGKTPRPAVQATGREAMRDLAQISMLGTLAMLGIAAQSSHAASQMLAPVHVGVVPSTATGGLYIAKEKGYFTALGLDVTIEDVTSGGQMQAMLATNRLQVLGGGVSVGMINAMAGGLPAKIYYTLAQNPSGHVILVRPDLAGTIKRASDLKGRILALNGRGTIDDYEAEEFLASGGLGFGDADIKIIPLPDMAAALQNKAIDAAMMFPPLSTVTMQKGLGVRWAEPEEHVRITPLLIAVGQFNTDWVNDNEKAARSFLEGILKGTREYCEAYHVGANRAEVVTILAKYSSVHDPALIERMEWGSSDPQGRIPTDSLMDFQKFELAQKQIEKPVSLEQMVEPHWIRDAAQQLGPFTLAHDDGKPGCR
jgi:NitT/TauT family transport system substrate-binding protein